MIELLRQTAQLSGQRLARSRTEAVREAIRQNEKNGPVACFQAAWRAASLIGIPTPMRIVERADLPVLCWTDGTGFCLLSDIATNGRFVGRTEDGRTIAVAVEDARVFMRLVKREQVEATPRALQLVASAVLEHKIVLIESVMATIVVSALALGASLYSMQVYDRVIPSQGYQTLIVLTVGVVVAVLLEFLLKQVRAHIIDHTGTEIDKKLSQWFFERMQDVRLESRPTTVGTLAAQVKGFETVRAMFTSGSLFVFADIPFAIFFIGIIALIGGSAVLVPLVALPLALAAGLVFQRGIRLQARRMTISSYRKNGLLVESVEGAESLKAAHGEWQLASRWKALVAEVAHADEKIRLYSAWSQNLTAVLQQAGYVALVAYGSYLTVNNQLTMGGLIAITIISNRAMTPIVQLPGMLVQWAQAQAAIDGLDQIIALPNEQDRLEERLTPQALEPELRFEKIRFSYGPQKAVLEIDELSITAGEKVGLLGPVGSGKSTLLKVASGLYRAQDGREFLGGVDMAMLNPSVTRELIGYLPQDQRLISGTLRQNVLLGLPDPGDEAILGAARLVGLLELITQNPRGLSLEISEGGRGVSGGQKQMIALTRLVLARPRMWLLDEPTASMDNESEMRIVRALREILQSGDTLVVATHKTALLPLLTRLIVVRDGRIVMDGPRDAVLAALQGRPQPAPAVVARVGGASA